MDDPPLSQREEPLVETVDEEEDVAPQARLPKVPQGTTDAHETP